MQAARLEEARALLQEARDWVGLVDLSEEDAAQAGAFHERLEAFLGVHTETPKPDKVEDLYRLVLSTRAQMERAERERDECRRLMNDVLTSEPRDKRHVLYRVRRFGVAYTQWEEAERLYHRAEGAYCRALTREDQE